MTHHLRAPFPAPAKLFRRTSLPKRFFRILLLASATGWCYGCGVQGTPHPPRIEIPAKVSDFSAQQVGQSVEINCTLPELATDGRRLTKPMEIEIILAAVPKSTGIAKLPPPQVWIHLSRDEWLPHAPGKTFSYAAHMTGREYHDWQGQTLAMGIRTLTRGFQHRALASDASNIVDVSFYDVSPPVENFKLTTTEKAVELEFSAPATTLGGVPVHDFAGFGIYRSSTGKPGSFETLGDLSAAPYRDTNFEFGQTYYYQVRAQFGLPGRLAMSEPSPAVKITPRDTFPPAAPEDLSSVYSAGGVELVWTANTEGDLAGYNVYRLENQAVQRVNKELVRTPIFRDTGATPGSTVNYYVTAVDTSGNESKPSKHEEVETK